MAFRVGTANLSKGELSEELLARVDVAPCDAGVKRARNVVIRNYGGMEKRSGTRLVAEVRDASHPTASCRFNSAYTKPTL